MEMVLADLLPWIPAYAGMTGSGVRGSPCACAASGAMLSAHHHRRRAESCIGLSALAIGLRRDPRHLKASALVRGPNRPRSAIAGIAFMVAAGCVVSLNDATVKWLSTELPVGQIVCLRAAVALTLGLLFAWRESGHISFRISSPRLQLLRGLLAAGGMFLFVLGLRHLPLADAVAILFAAPLFSFVLAVIILGEGLNARRILAALTGFAGIVVMARPGTPHFTWVLLLPLGAAVCGGLREVITRHLSHRDASSSTYLAGTAVVAMASLASIALGWELPSARQLLLLALAGVLVGFAEYFMIEAYRHAEVTLVAPFVYTSMVWASLFGYLIFDAIPGLAVVAGAALIIASGLYLFRAEAGGRTVPISRRRRPPRI